MLIYSFAMSGVPVQPVKSIEELAAEYRALVEAMRDIAPHIVERLGDVALIQPEVLDTVVASTKTVEEIGSKIMVAANVATAYVDTEATPTTETETAQPTAPQVIEQGGLIAEAQAEEQDVFDRESLLQYLSEKTGVVPIWQIIREHFGVSRLERGAFDDFVRELNYLGEQGVLMHKGNRYGAANNAPVAPAETITPPAIQEDTVTTGEVEQLPDMVELDDLEQEILQFAQFNDFFRIEELHRGVASLGAMSKEEYDAFKATFTKIRERICSYLEQTTGESFVWATKSRNRGKRYQLVNASTVADLPEDVTVELIHSSEKPRKQNDLTSKTSGQTEAPTAPKQQKSAPAPPTKERFYDRLAAQQTEAPVPQDTGQETSGELSAREYLRAARFVGNVLSYLTVIETQTDSNEGMKWTKMAEQISQQLDIPMEEAKDVIRDLESASLLHHVGNHRGTRKLTTSTEARDKYQAQRREHPESCAEKREIDEQARIKELRTIYGSRILDFLSTLRKHQTEFKTAIAAAVGDGLEVEDVNAICNLLASEGLVEPKAPKGRGTGRTRKGKTWSITGRGRNAISQDGRLTNAERSQLARTYRS